MTNDSGVPFGHRQRIRHRLTDRVWLAEQLTRRWGDPDVADYTLTGRDILEEHPRIGPVDTYRRAAVEIAGAQARPHGKEAERLAKRDEGNLRRLRKQLSWNFSVRSRGPRWSLVKLLVEHLVPAEEQPATLARLADLHRAARGHYPPGFDPDAVEAAGPAPDPGGATLVELLERRTAELDAVQAENQRLRADLANLTGRPWQLESPADGAEDGGGSVPSPRTGRNEGHFGRLTGLDEGPVPRRPDRVDLVVPRSSGPAGATYRMAEEFGHGGPRATSGPAGRHTPPPRSVDRFPQPGVGRNLASNAVWRQPPT